jgi:CBS domain containing-hemolysin-like protein
LVVILIAATAFFVAAEFAVVKVRPTLINQLASEGNKRAIAAQKVISNLDGYLSACQLGITITALGLGVIGEPAVGELLKLVFQLDNQQLAATVSHVTAFTLITFLHVVVGELAPKTWAIQKAERISLWFSPLLIAFYKIMYPFIWLLNGSANILVKMFGLQPAKEHDLAHTEEELRQILTHSLDRGEINRTEYEYVTNIFEFDERIAREIMVPRTEMACVYTNLSLEENMEIIKKEGYTRFPVAEEDKDHIIGFIHVKELFMKYMENPAVNIQDLIRPILFANESTPIKTLMGRMQKERNPMAVLVD